MAETASEMFPELKQGGTAPASAPKSSESEMFPELNVSGGEQSNPMGAALGHISAFGSQALQGLLSVPAAAQSGMEAINPAVWAGESVKQGRPAQFPNVPSQSQSLQQKIKDITQADKLLKEHPLTGQIGGLAGSFFTPLPLPGLGALPRLAQHALRGGMGGGFFGAAEELNQPGAPDFGKALGRGLANVPAGMALGAGLGMGIDKVAEHLKSKQAQRVAEALQRQAQAAMDDAAERARNVYGIGPGEEQTISGQRSGPYQPDPMPPKAPGPYDFKDTPHKSVVSKYSPDAPEPKAPGPYDFPDTPHQSVVTKYKPDGSTTYAPEPIKPSSPYDVGPGKNQRISGKASRSRPGGTHEAPPETPADPPGPGTDSGGNSGGSSGGAPPREVPDSWREFVHEESRPATPRETTALFTLATSKIQFDQAEARLQGAIRQLAAYLKLTLRSTEKKYTPAGWLDIQRSLENMKFTKTPRSEAFVEAHVKQRFPQDYKFRSTTVQGMFKEVQELLEHRDFTQAAYDVVRKEAVNKAPFEQRIALTVTGIDRRKYNVSVFSTKQYKFDFATPAEKAAYDQVVKFANNAGPHGTDYSHGSFEEAINSNPDLKATLKAWGLGEYVDATFKRASKQVKGTASGVFGPFALVYHVIDAAVKEAHASGFNIRTEDLIAKVIETIKAKGLDKEFNPRFVRALTETMVNSDMVRHYDPDFAWKRDGYLAAREKATLGAREATTAEKQQLNNMTPAEIRKTGIKGWSRAEVEKELAGRRIDEGYKKELKARIEHLEKGGAQPGFAGNDALLEVLTQDMEMISPSGGGSNRMRKVGGKVMGGLYEATFVGNQKVAQLHGWEFATSQFSDSPILTAKALKNYLSDPIAREYAHALVGPGMQQRLIEGQDKFAIGRWFDETFNTPIQHFIENKLPLGELVWKAGTAELPEEIKTAASALLAAERVAKNLKYPGGARQFMADYLATAKGGTIPESRRTLLARAEIESLRDRNEKIMYLPPGPIQERTVVQRNGGLNGMALMLRGVITQSRVLAGYADDFSHALSKGDFLKTTDAARKLAFAHVVIAFESGTYALPSYVWWMLSAASPMVASELHKLFRQLNEANPLGRTSKELGPKWFPLIEGGSFFALSIARGVAETMNVKALLNDKDHHMLWSATGQIMASMGVSRIGFGGESQWMQLYRAAEAGMRGQTKKVVKVYTESKGVKDLLAHDSKKLGQKSFKRDPWEGISDWLIQGERRDMAEYRQNLEEREEKAGQRQLRKDVKKLPKALGL